MLFSERPECDTVRGEPLKGANRADKAGRPAPAHHRLPALILCSVKNSKLGLAEPLLKLHLVARHRSNPQKQPYVPLLYHDLMAEDSAKSGICLASVRG